MTVDLSKAKKGDRVRFRCGGEAVVSRVLREGDRVVDVEFEGATKLLRWYKNGLFYDPKIGPLDIISITPPAFDWSTVKAGDAFLHKMAADTPMYYVGFNPLSKRHILADKVRLYDVSKHGEAGDIHLENIYRAPEHDIEVQS